MDETYNSSSPWWLFVRMLVLHLSCCCQTGDDDCCNCSNYSDDNSAQDSDHIVGMHHCSHHVALDVESVVDQIQKQSCRGALRWQSADAGAVNYLHHLMPALSRAMLHKCGKATSLWWHDAQSHPSGYRPLLGGECDDGMHNEGPQHQIHDLPQPKIIICLLDRLINTNDELIFTITMYSVFFYSVICKITK